MHDDWTLIQACRRGDPLAWEQIIAKYQRLVYSVALNLGLTNDDASDIVQITFGILLQSLHSFDENVRLGGWLITVARRHTWRLRQRYQREIAHDPDDLIEQAPHDSHNPFQQWDTLEWLNDGLNLLDPRCRELLMLLYFAKEPLPYSDVAQRLNMPVGSIGPNRARCLARLKQHLTQKPRSF